MMRRISAPILVFLIAGSARAADLWVDHDGLGGACDDARAASAVTQTTPWCTLATAAQNVQPGDVVHVRGGTYSEVEACPSCDDDAVLQIVSNGTASQWIRFQAEPGETVTLTPGSGGAVHGVLIKNGSSGRYVEIDGFEITGFPGNCVEVQKETDVTLRGLDVHGCTGTGAVELHSTARATLTESRVHDNATVGWTSAVDLFECLDGNVVSRNFIHDNQDDPTPGNPDSEGHGITLDTCLAAGGALIENNVIWGNEGWCMALYKSDHAIVRNNTCWQNGTRDGVGEVSVFGNDYQLHNNVFLPRDGRVALTLRYNQSGYTVDPTTLLEDSNLLWSPTYTDVVSFDDGGPITLAQYQSTNPRGWGASDLGVDPMLVNTGAADFSLSSGSPAVDSGDDAHAAANDVLGAVRPYDGDGDGTAHVDRGAYELGAPPGTGGGGGTSSGGTTGTGAGTGTGGTAVGGTNGNGGSSAGGSSAGGNKAASSSDSGGGCGCRTARSAGGTAALAWLLLIGLATARVRRRSLRRAHAG